jgi:hypothetical protein
MPLVPQSFLATHPLRIDLPDGTQVRFRGLQCAARSACHWKRPVWDEDHGSGYSFRECVDIVANADNQGRWS